MKKFLLSLAVSAVTASTTLCSAGLFAKAADNTPRIYVDLVYETETQIRADIMFENVPDASNGGFHLNVSSGWDIVMMDTDTDRMEIENKNRNCTGRKAIIYGTVSSNPTDNVAIAFSASQDYNFNGHFCSFYVNKTSAYSEANSNISVYFTKQGNYDDHISPYGSSVHHFAPDSNEPIKLPIITRTAEYRIGDTDANGRVNASDATDVQVALSKNGSAPIKVSQIENNFKTFFPHATAPAAGDANCDGIISMDDVYYILKNYGSSSTGGGYIGNVGSKAIYEYYNG